MRIESIFQIFLLLAFSGVSIIGSLWWVRHTWKKNKKLSKIGLFILFSGILINPYLHVLIGGMLYSDNLLTLLQHLKKESSVGMSLGDITAVVGSPSVLERIGSNTFILRYYEHPFFLYSFSEIVLKISDDKLSEYWIVNTL
ncbi:MAG: hypothetical protein CSA42_08175 [Gammaproteobacteria bacterium]|nr:MAG: hypothetical protein CSA42_08175 [Gammaproteobacteria bacterium]